MLSPQKQLDQMKPNLVCEVLTCMGRATAKKIDPTPLGPGELSKRQISLNFSYKVNFKDFHSKLIRFARASSYVADFNTRNKLLTQKLLKKGYRYHKLRKTFSNFYRRYYDLISKFQV